jgi:hypothetical protein
MEEYKMITTAEVKSFFVDFTSFLKRLVTFVLKAVKKNVLLCLFSFLIVVATGYFYQKRQAAYFQSEMVCAYNNLHKKTFGEMVHRLDKLAKSGSYKQLASELQISPAEASAIVGLDAKNVAGSPLYEDITAERTPMYFTLTATDRSVFPKVQPALVHYLNSTPYQQRRTELEKARFNQKIGFISNSLSQVDSVIISYSSFVKHIRATSDSASGFSNIAALFSYKDQLEDKMLDYQKSLGTMESVEVIYGFATPDYPIETGDKFWFRLVFAALLFSIGISVIKQGLTDGK